MIRNKLCPNCGDTAHTLKPQDINSVWQCNNCSSAQPAYSFEEMAQVVMEKVFGLKPGLITEVPNWTVYLESTEGEREVPQAALEEHLAISGRWPEIGKPLFTKGAIPYGKVIRIDKKGLS